MNVQSGPRNELRTAAPHTHPGPQSLYMAGDLAEKRVKNYAPIAKIPTHQRNSHSGLITVDTSRDVQETPHEGAISRAIFMS